jgi:hypothetical protein
MVLLLLVAAPFPANMPPSCADYTVLRFREPNAKARNCTVLCGLLARLLQERVRKLAGQTHSVDPFTGESLGGFPSAAARLDGSRARVPAGRNQAPSAFHRQRKQAGTDRRERVLRRACSQRRAVPIWSQPQESVRKAAYHSSGISGSSGTVCRRVASSAGTPRCMSGPRM